MAIMISMSASKKPYIGGQAVIEGVMMRAPGGMSVAVRRPDGTIVLQEGPLRTGLTSKRLWKLPGFRGIATLVDSMKIGYAALHFSAEQQMTEEELEADGDAGQWAMVLSTVFALGLFIALPQLLATGAGKLFGVDFALSDPNYHIVIGGFKLLIVLAYMVGISMIPEIRRVFQYHGAEHKTINAYEAELPLTVENVRAQTRLHPRCGTTFLILVVIVSVVVGSLAAPLLLPGAEGALGWVALLVMRIALLPLIAGISFEFQRFTARYCMTGPLRALIYPGFAVQMISTRDPDDAQIEVAIAALQTAEWREKFAGDLPSDELIVFPDFERFSAALPNLRGVKPAAVAAE